MTLAIGSSTNYTSKFYTNITDQPNFIQSSYFKTDANIALRGPNDGWEIALIGKNLSDVVTAGECFNSDANVGAGLTFGSFIQQAGMATGGGAGEDGSECVADRGREVWIRLTLRPLALLSH
jgi:iron complex outermembrane receptor protein